MRPSPGNGILLCAHSLSKGSRKGRWEAHRTGTELKATIRECVVSNMEMMSFLCENQLRYEGCRSSMISDWRDTEAALPGGLEDLQEQPWPAWVPFSQSPSHSSLPLANFLPWPTSSASDSTVHIPFSHPPDNLTLSSIILSSPQSLIHQVTSCLPLSFFPLPHCLTSPSELPGNILIRCVKVINIHK